MASLDYFCSLLEKSLNLEENTVKLIIYNTGMVCIKSFDEEFIRKFYKSCREMFPDRKDIRAEFSKLVENEFKNKPLITCSFCDCCSNINLTFCKNESCESHLCHYHLIQKVYIDITSCRTVYYTCPHCRRKVC